MFGSQFTGVALPIIAALTLNASPSQFGILNALATAPFLLFGLFVGVWVDRMARRPVLIVGDVGRGVLVAVIAALVLAGTLNIVHLYAVAFLTGVLTVFFDVAYQSYVPSLVERDQLVEANGKLEVTRAASQVVGPPIGGVVVQFLSASAAMVVDAATFFVSGAFLVAIRRPEAVERTVRKSMAADLREGLGTVFGEPRLRAIAGCTGTSNFFFAVFMAVFILFALRDLGLNAAALGLVFGLGSVGAVVGALTAGRLGKRFGVGRAIIGSAIGFGVSGIPIAVATPPLAIPLLILSQVLLTIMALVYNVNQVSLRQAITANRLQGRMNATMRFLVWGTLPIGALVGGFLGELIGLRATVWVAIAGATTAFLFVLFSPVRLVREIPSAPAD